MNDALQIAVLWKALRMSQLRNRASRGKQIQVERENGSHHLYRANPATIDADK